MSILSLHLYYRGNGYIHSGFFTIKGTIPNLELSSKQGLFLVEVPVVNRMDNADPPDKIAIQWIAWFVLLTLNRQILI